MNNFDSMIEPVPNISTVVDEDRDFIASDKSIQELCDETECLKLIDEFHKLYEDRIKLVDRVCFTELDRVSMKLEISKEWIKNLREQNITLVQTVEELEQTVCSKAKILEQQLKQTSVLASKKKTESISTEKTINELSSRVSNLEKHEEYMQQRVEFLQSDIRSLLEFIRRAAQEKRWNLDGITFFEIQPSDIPVPIDCSCDQEETNHENIQSLKLQIEHFQENEKKMIAYQTELKDEVTRLNEKLEIKEDTIKKHCTQFQNLSDNLKKRAKFANQVSCNSVDETCAVENVFVDTNTCQENEVISYLTKVKSWMEQEKEDLFKLKADLENTLKKLYSEKDQECCETINEFDENSFYELTKNIDCVNKMCSKKEELIANINSSILCTDVNQQFKLMDIFRACAIEAQVTTEDLREEIGIIVSTFKSRHQKYTDLNKEIMNVQNQLIRSRERTIEAINKLQLKEEESKRHNERINSGNVKLKDIKDKINHAQSRMSFHITEMQPNLEEKVFSNYTEMCMCNDLLHSAIEEIEQTSNSLQVFQGCCIATEVEQLKNQLYEMDLSIKKLQQRIHDALLEHDVVESTLSQKEKKLLKLEKEVDAIHSKIRHILDKFIFSKDQVCDNKVAESQLYTQTLNEILQTKQDLHRLRKEHDELKCKLVQKSRYTECDDNTCLWKCRMTDLQDQVKIMQHEAKCNQETNNFLKKNIESIEEELRIVQAKAHKFKRSHSIDNIELQKKLMKLENALKLQGEIECSLRQQLNDNEVELKKSKEVLNSFYAENNVEETLLHCGCNQFKHDAMIVPQLLKTLQDTIKSTKCGLQELKTEFKTLICEDQSNLCSSARSVMNLMDKLQKYEDELNHCSQETEKLKHVLSKKDKLLEDMDKIIRIQKDSIFMTQAELKELHQNLQKKIDNKDQVISNNEKEKQELLKQNQLQIQTICHLQNAVVEAKRCIDQMGHGTMSDLQEKCRIIRLLTVYVEETQSQYNECFAEAAKQDKLLELQREVISHLQQKMCYLEYDNCSTITSIHDMHYSILRTIKEQLEAHVNDIQDLKYKMDILIQLKCCSENKYKNMKKLWQETEGKLQELKKSAFKPQQTTKTYEDKECQCKVEVVDNDCVTEDTVNFNELTCNNTKQCKNFLRGHELQSEIDTLSRENEDMKKQLQKCKLDFDIIDKELKIERENGTYTQQVSFELKKIRDTECCLRYENEQLRSDLKKQAKQIEKLQLVKENNVKFEKLVTKLEDKQMQINSLCNQVTNNEIVMKKQVEAIEELEKKLDIKNKEIKEYLSELSDAEEEMSSLHDRIQFFKNLLTEKSNDMSKLQADYEILKNDNSILRMENNAFENKSKEEYGQLKNMVEKEQEKNKKIEMSKCCIVQQLQECMEQNCILSKEKAMVEQNNCDIISELQETHKSLLELRKECHLKNKSLACISAELTETAMSRSELCNQSQYVVSCIRVWMEEQREYVKTLNSKLKSYQQQLLQLGFEKKALLDEIRKLKRINHLLTQRLKRIHKYGGKNVKNLCVGCHMVPPIVAQNADLLFPVNSKYSSSQKKLRISTRGNAWWFPKMKYLINELRKNNLEYKQNFSDEENTSRTLEESRDCGYQSSTSK